MGCVSYQHHIVIEGNIVTYGGTVWVVYHIATMIYYGIWDCGKNDKAAQMTEPFYEGGSYGSPISRLRPFAKLIHQYQRSLGGCLQHVPAHARLDMIRLTAAAQGPLSHCTLLYWCQAEGTDVKRQVCFHGRCLRAQVFAPL